MTLRERLFGRVRTAGSREALIEGGLGDLADTSPAPDTMLPDTGVGVELERLLSSAWIRSPDGRFGTRASTVVVAERVGSGAAETIEITVHERNFDGADGPEFGSDRRFTFPVAADDTRHP